MNSKWQRAGQQVKPGLKIVGKLALLTELRYGPAGVAGWAVKSVARRTLKMLLAVALEDRSVVVFDSQTFNLIRRFESAGAVTALCMNESGRWLLVADESGDVRVFDLPNSESGDRN